MLNAQRPYQRLQLDPRRALPCSVRPVPGFCWWPVMPVTRLSRMIVMTGLWLYTTFTSAGMPVWKKVESPITAT